MSDVTRIVFAIDAGDPQAAAQLLPLVYDELRKLAAGHMANEAPGHTLDPTALGHEAYLRLAASPRRQTGGRSFAHRHPLFAPPAAATRPIPLRSSRPMQARKPGARPKH